MYRLFQDTIHAQMDSWNDLISMFDKLCTNLWTASRRNGFSRCILYFGQRESLFENLWDVLLIMLRQVLILLSPSTSPKRHTFNPLRLRLFRQQTLSLDVLLPCKNERSTSPEFIHRSTLHENRLRFDSNESTFEPFRTLTSNTAISY